MSPKYDNEEARKAGLAKAFLKFTELLVREHDLSLEVLSSSAGSDRMTAAKAARSLPPDYLMTPLEVGQTLGVSPKTLANLRSKGGHIPFTRTGRLIRYRHGDVLDYIRAGKCLSTSEKVSAP